MSVEKIEVIKTYIVDKYGIIIDDQNAEDIELIRCKNCRYATETGYRDEETGEELLGCSCLVNGIDSDYVMTVKGSSFCSWAEKR